MSGQKKAVRLIVESGIVPRNALQQLANYRLIPESYVESHGTRPISLEQGWDTVEGFVDELGQALKEDIGTIRETEFDGPSGSARKATLYWKDEHGTYEKNASAVVDKLGRVFVQPSEGLDKVIAVSIDGGEPQSVVRAEPRYEGDWPAAWVFYLSTSKEDDDASQ